MRICAAIFHKRRPIAGNNRAEGSAAAAFIFIAIHGQRALARLIRGYLLQRDARVYFLTARTTGSRAEQRQRDSSI